MKGERSPARILRDSPYLKSSDYMLNEIIMKYLAEVFDMAFNLDVPIKSILAPQGFSTDIERERLNTGE